MHCMYLYNCTTFHLRRAFSRLVSLPLPGKSSVQEAIADQILVAETARAAGDVAKAYQVTLYARKKGGKDLT